MHRVFRLLFLAFACPVLTAAQARPAPETLARSLQLRYQGIQDFSADFTHVYRGGVLRTQSREHGTVKIKKPGRMRWLYTGPEKKEFVSDGQKVYAYIPEDRQVIVSDVPPGDETTSAALFLAGRGDLVRDFTAQHAESSTPGLVSLRLTPRRPEQEYEWLVVNADAATLQIRGLTTRDRQGGESTLSFTNLKENQRISDKEFAFRIPPGMDVVTNGTHK